MSDKIFNNSFYESSYDGRSVTWKKDPSYADETDTESKLIKDILSNEIHELISNSKFNKLNKSKGTTRIPKLNKVQISIVYSYIIDNLTGYNPIDIFSVASSYFDIKPTKFYNSLDNIHKDQLINEMDKRRNIIENRGIKRLY